MNVHDEDLMAYADGQLDAERRQAIDAALSGDAALRARVAALRTQREQVAAAYAGVLDEAVPDRLLALLERGPKQPGVVSDLASARARSAGKRIVDDRAGWMRWGGMAAAMLLGLLLGLLFAPGGDDDALVAERGGRLVAGGVLTQALNTQLAADTGTGPAVAVQLSFVDKSGRYCRTFSSAQVAGLACREPERWAVHLAVPAQADAAAPMRQAATALPRAVLDLVDERIDGTALNAAQERDARTRQWKR
jgi:hypothetical protein